MGSNFSNKHWGDCILFLTPRINIFNYFRQEGEWRAQKQQPRRGDPNYSEEVPPPRARDSLQTLEVEKEKEIREVRSHVQK